MSGLNKSYTKKDIGKEISDVSNDTIFTSIKKKDGGITDEILIMKPDDIIPNMLEHIKSVTTVLKLPPTITRILLTHFKWNKEKLYERYFACDLEQLFKDIGVANPLTEMDTDSITGSSQESKIHICETCFLAIKLSVQNRLTCAHVLCTDCLLLYLTTKIMYNGDVYKITCPSTNCNQVICDAVVLSIIEDRNVLAKFLLLIRNSYVESNRLLRWCPSPGCLNVIKIPRVEPRPITCICMHTFCCVCGETWHEPITCNLLKRWIKRSSAHSEVESLTWIAMNTKKCPTCHINIQKEGGCDLVDCKNQNCHTTICWLCVSPWIPENNPCCLCKLYIEHNENRQEAPIGDDDESFLFYWNHYMNHKRSLTHELKLYATIEIKMPQIEENNMMYTKIEYLKKAVDTLCQCRRTLMSTYVLAYFLRKFNHSPSFEKYQWDLEIATADLFKYLEIDLTSESLNVIKQEVLDKYKYCERWRKGLLHISMTILNETGERIYSN